jgi:hypothetical protein
MNNLGIVLDAVANYRPISRSMLEAALEELVTLQAGVANPKIAYYAKPAEVVEMIENNFIYHSPMPSQVEKYAELRAKAKALALDFASLCPPSRELSKALADLEQAVMWANAAIARKE